MKIVTGINRFGTEGISGAISTDLSGLKLLSEDVIDDLHLDDFFSEAQEELEFAIESLDDISISDGIFDRVFMMRDISELDLAIGKQADYLFSHPVLKRSILDGKLDTLSHDYLGNEEVGMLDPIYRDVVGDVLFEEEDGGWVSRHYPLEESELSRKEKIAAVLNYRYIESRWSDIFGYTPDSPEVDDEGNLIY